MSKKLWGGKAKMDIIGVNDSNVDTEHICCAITDKKGECCVSSKKAWLRECYNDGLVFKKLNVRGKVFIEYIPAENAWCPVIADEYMFINCFWVSGQFKGQGYATKLLEECISDAKFQGKKGLVILSSKKKMPFLSDPKYLKYKGFEVCGTAEPYFELLYLPFEKSAEKPRFKECCQKGVIGLILLKPMPTH
jgi:ribosomal protein S18 acetylase RimI-like enzyme